jgi:hypothetical protein
VSVLFSAIFVVLLSMLTLASVLLGDGNLGLSLVPALVLAVLYAIWRLPLRYPVLALTFCALTLENPSDVPAAGVWRSPLYALGALLLAHMNLSFAQKWMFFSGLDLVLLYLFAVAVVRWARGSPVHRVGPLEGPSPMPLFAAVSLGGAAWMWVWGMARGDADVASSLWQVQRVAYLPLLFFLFHLVLRRPKDRAALGKVFLTAACLKAALAVYVRTAVPPPAGESTLAYATTHADSMLYAGAFCLVISLVFERLDKRRALCALLVLPLLAAGMIANHRRIVWVEVAAGLAALYALTPVTRLTRSLARAAVLATPLAIVYVAVGWGSASGVFQPVELLRSVVDSQADASTAWRDWENYNLFFTLRQGPLLGTGYGHGYIEIVKLPDISQAYALYRFIPHNSILGLWAYGGFVGFTALWTMLVVGVFLAVRASRYATKAADRTAAITATVMIVVYLVHCYGDMGLGTWTSVFTVAPALAVASRLASSTGAWPARVRSARSPSALSWAPRPSSLASGGVS